MRKTIRKLTRVGSSQTHQCPQEALAQIEPVMRTATPKITDMWIETYEYASHLRLLVRRWAIAKTPPTTKPTSATIASGTCR